jgi:hypothetical protein
MPHVGKKSFGYSTAGKKKAKAYAAKTGKSIKMTNAKPMAKKKK